MGMLEDNVEVLRKMEIVCKGFPISGPPGKKKVIAGDNLTKKDAHNLARSLRSKGLFGTVFPSDKFKKKRMVVYFK